MKIRKHLNRLIRRRVAEDDLEQEIHSHLALEAQERMDRGQTEDQAWAGARRDFGNPLLIREFTRSEWGWGWLEVLMKDFRYTCRTLMKAPAFTAVTLLTLATGIGATTAIFSVVHAVLLEPLPYKEPDRLIALWSSAPSLNVPKAFVSIAEYLDWRTQNSVFEEIGITRPIANLNLTGGGSPERLEGARISETVLPTLGVRPLLGRNITEQERRADAPVALLSYGLWQRRFGGDPGILGSSIRLNGVPHQVIGVMPRGFQYPGTHEIWVPLFFPPEEVQSRIGSNYVAVGRLKRGFSAPQARSQMETIAARLARQYPDTNGMLRVVLEPLAESVTGSVRTPLIAVFASVIALLAIGCSNIAGLLLARATARLKEFSLRAALGASRGRITAQLFAEVVPLAVFGVGGGVGVAWLALGPLTSLLPADMPRIGSIGLNLPVLAFAAVLSLVTASVAVVVPALHAVRPDVARSLKEDSRTLAGARSRLRSALVIAQIAIALALVVCSGLLLRSLDRLARVQPGFDTRGVLTMHLAVTRTRYSQDTEVARYCGRLVEAVAGLPGVEAAGMVNRLPLSGIDQTLPLEFEGVDPQKDPIGNIDSRVITPDYFRAMGIRLVRGRVFNDQDTETSRPVGIIDEQLGKRIWPNSDPLGKRFRFGVKGREGPWVEIVGVAGHIRNQSLDIDVRPQVYWSHRQRTQDRMVLVVRTRVDPSPITASVIQRIHTIDPEQPVYHVRTMEQWRERSLQQRHLTTGLISVFGALSLFLALLGIYGVLAYMTSQRIREFGIRIALGATSRGIQVLVLRHAIALAAAGIILGAALAIPLAALIRSLLFEVHATDQTVLVAAPATLIAVALAAGLVPARRAMRTEPSAALRHE